MTLKYLPLLLWLAPLAATSQTLAPKQRVLQTAISSPDDEGGSFITPNGNKIFFVRNAAVGKGEQENQDLYYADRTPTGWTNPVKVGGQVNNDDNNTIAGSNADGSVIYLNSVYDKKGRSKTGLSRSRWENGDYTKPEPLFDFDYKWPKKGFFCASVPADESYVLVSMNATGVVDNEDLFVFEKGADGKFVQEPKSLGTVINTGVFESTPFYSQTFKTLFFTRPKSARSNEADILFSQRLDDSWTNWSAPKPVDELFKTSTGNLPKAQQTLDVNTVGFDGSFVIDNTNTAYFISGPKNDAAAKGDVYAISLIPDTLPKPPEPVAVAPTPEPEPVAAPTPTPAPVADDNSYEDLTFEFDSDALTDVDKAEADRLADAVKKSKRISVHLHGYADNVGDEAYNKVLSVRRANTVKRYLTQHGLAANRIKVTGYGELNPKSSNDTDEGRAQNRRVELKIIKK